MTPRWGVRCLCVFIGYASTVDRLDSYIVEEILNPLPRSPAATPHERHLHQKVFESVMKNGLKLVVSMGGENTHRDVKRENIMVRMYKGEDRYKNLLTAREALKELRDGVQGRGFWLLATFFEKDFSCGLHIPKTLSKPPQSP